MGGLLTRFRGTAPAAAISRTGVGAEGHAAAAMDADKGLAGIVQIDGIHRAGLGAVAAMDAERLFDRHAAPPALDKGPRGAGRRARGWIAGHTVDGGEAAGQASRGLNADAGPSARTGFRAPAGAQAREQE